MCLLFTYSDENISSRLRATDPGFGQGGGDVPRTGNASCDCFTQCQTKTPQTERGFDFTQRQRPRAVDQKLNLAFLSPKRIVGGTNFFGRLYAP